MNPVRGYLGLALCAAAGLAQSQGTFTTTGNMTMPRMYHTATLLTNGKVLIVGSGDGPPGHCCRSAELYDPSTETFAPTGDRNGGRTWNTATLLPDGMVLIAGPSATACDCNGAGVGPGPTAELYNPETGTFSSTGSMVTPRGGFSATLLPNGKVLIAGGSCCTIYPATYPTTAELYDPLTGTFTRTGDMINGREDHTATLLSNGKVLIAGGQMNDVWVTAAELYDPATGAFSSVGGTESISGASGIWLTDLQPDGKVFSLALLSASSGGLAVVYDPSTATFQATGGRTGVNGTTTLLPDGTVLMAGSNFQEFHHSADIYDPAKGAFTQTGQLITPRGGHAATLLPDGSVLVSGGSVAGELLASAEIYHPAFTIGAPVIDSMSNGSSQGAVLHAGTGNVASASNPAIPGEALEIYGSGLMDGSVIPPQVSIGGRPAEVLWFGNAPGYAGLNQINVRVPAGVAPGPIPVWLNYIGRPSNVVTIGVSKP